MELSLSLRQRELINYLRGASGYITGEELARYLGVSSRTVRHDVAQINSELAGTGVSISSKHSFGYIIQADNVRSLREITQASESFVSRSERLRHIAQRLALSDRPIDLDDLAYEMYISKTTLEYDLKEFRRRYAMAEPRLTLLRRQNSIYLEDDERKRRHLLCRLYSAAWDFSGRGNTFFKYSFLTENLVNLCILETNYCLDKHGIVIEDNNLVYLNLMLAVACQRIRQGKELSSPRENMFISAPAQSCADEFLDALEEKLGCSYNRDERREIYELLSCSLIPNIAEIREIGISLSFPQELRSFGEEYIDRLRRVYGLDLTGDNEFLLVLLIFLQYLTLPLHYLHSTRSIQQSFQLMCPIEMELAFSIQPLAKDFYGRHLDFNELMYLSLALSGAMSRNQPDRLRTVIMSHYNEPAAWNIRAKVEEKFSSNVVVTDLLSMYRKDSYDFSATDLILSTTDKAVTPAYSIPQIKLSPFFTEEDQQKIQRHLDKVRFEHLYGHPFPDTLTLLEEAHWNELVEAGSFQQLLDMLGSQMLEGGWAGQDYLEDVALREQLATFASHPAFVIVHSSVPARQTHIEIATLDHRVSVRKNKIRLVIMLAMAKEDQGLIFKLFNDLYMGGFDPEDTRFLKTKIEYMNFFRRQLAK